jgi:SEC-C motif
MRVGRNDPCPCGRGQKYKKCCLPKEEALALAKARGRARPLPPEVVAQLRAKRMAEDERVQKYGQVRPIIHTEFQGNKIVAVGDSIFWGKHWKTFVDFLLHYITHVMTKEWRQAELAKPLTDRHPIMQWHDAMTRFLSSGAAIDGGLREGIPDGPTQAYFSLAYDLYVVRDHLLLQERLTKRLRHPDQFQGARYELFAIATCIRAGYTIALEDESDTSTKHHEFLATHSDTKQVIAVEAKSKHRDGVLGFNGTPKSREAWNAGLNRLLNEALKKPTPHPRVIFLDQNLPGDASREQVDGWLNEMIAMLNKPLMKNGGVSPWNMLMLTNHPYHYGAEGAPYPREQGLVHLPDRPVTPMTHPGALLALIQAARQFGKIPSSFPE